MIDVKQNTDNSNKHEPQTEMKKDFSLERELDKLHKFYGKIVEHCEMYHREVKSLTARLDESWSMVKSSNDTILKLQEEVKALQAKMEENSNDFKNLP
jgi:peptidoglycan hydrolase CwlO-like protein